MGSVNKRFVCDKEVKLWSDFSINRVPGDERVPPNELHSNEGRAIYVTRLEYKTRQAGYNGSIVTKAPATRQEEFTEWPEPKSHENRNYLAQQLQFKWANYKITKEPKWTGDAIRYYRHRSTSWCKRHSKKNTFSVNAAHGAPTGEDLGLEDAPSQHSTNSPSTRTRARKTFRLNRKENQSK